MNRCLKCLAAAAALAPVAGLLIAWLGIIHVGATGGHWAVTEWFLHWTMRSSVRTAALGIKKPSGFESAKHLKVTAVHFQMSCAECHGSPDRRRSPEMLAMLPPPPDLRDTVGNWKDEELFVIVRDGLRYTGMPAWPGAGRDDEVWAMVAFLKKLQTMSPARYKELSGAKDTESGDTLSGCLGCHEQGIEGNDPIAPVIAGQSNAYLAEALRAYRKGSRESGFMEVVVSRLKDADIDATAGHFARKDGLLSATPRARSGDERTLSLVQTGDPVKKIAACQACHDGRNPLYPLLSGQSRTFLIEQILLFKQDLRGDSPTARLMSRAVRHLTVEDVARLADYYASQPLAR